LRGEPKWFLRDWSGIADEGDRAETFVAECADYDCLEPSRRPVTVPPQTPAISIALSSEGRRLVIPMAPRASKPDFPRQLPPM